MSRKDDVRALLELAHQVDMKLQGARSEYDQHRREIITLEKRISGLLVQSRALHQEAERVEKEDADIGDIMARFPDVKT